MLPIIVGALLMAPVRSSVSPCPPEWGTAYSVPLILVGGQLMDVNGGHCIHARYDIFAAEAGYRDDNRDALANFGEVAAGIVLRWQQ